LEEGLADENPDVRWYLTEALQKNLNADAMKLAGRMLWDDDQFVRISAMDALILSGENVLQTISNSLSDNVIASSGALNDIIDTIKKVCSEGEVWIYSTLLAILQAMRRLGIDNLTVMPMLIESLKYSGARFSAARVLGAIGASAAVPALIEILEDKRQSVRVMVAQALGAIGESAAVPALTKALQDESKRVRREAAEALRNIGTAETINEVST
jgi:HEAT repeat protein